MSETTPEPKAYEDLLAELIEQVNPMYMKGFEAIFENTLEREQAFAVVLLAVEEQLSEVDSTELTETGMLRTQFHHLSNLAVLSQFIDLCGLSLYKDQIMQERIRALFGPVRK